MESAAKRKAANAAASDHDNRPAKRQKGPVRAVHGRRLMHRRGVFWRCTRRVGRDAGWALDKSARHLGGSTSSHHHLRRPLLAAPNTTRAPAMHRGLPGEHGGMAYEPLLTATPSRAGRHQCQLGDGSLDDDRGLEVPRQPEAGKRQDVRARPLSLVSHGIASTPSGEQFPRFPTDSLQGTTHSSSLPYPPG